MRIVFMGTPDYAATIFENLIGQHEVLAAFTRADAVRGRGKKLVASPVKQVALEHGIPVFTPRTLRDDEVVACLAELNPDVICVAAYGLILPPAVLELPPFGCLNVHASRLPELRGAAPVERAILAGLEETGVSIMLMEEGLDTGDYCVVRTTPIGRKTAPELTAELAELGSQALLTALSMIEQGSVSWVKQDDFFSTYAPKVAKGEFFLGPEMSASEALLKVQASSDAHPARCIVASRPVTVIEAEREPSRLRRAEINLAPGRIALHEKELYLGFSDEPVRIARIRPDGKQTMMGREFAMGVQNVKSGVVAWGHLNG